jgi:hypothetical protein
MQFRDHRPNREGVDLGQIRERAEAKASTLVPIYPRHHVTTGGTPSKGETPCFDAFSLPWQRLFL